MRSGLARSDPSGMSEAGNHADWKILHAVHDVAALTVPAIGPSARDRLCEALGYRLYRSLVAGLVGD